MVLHTVPDSLNVASWKKVVHFQNSSFENLAAQHEVVLQENILFLFILGLGARPLICRYYFAFS